jgi:chromatin structure-remodeling complex subunit RSC1/2
MQIETWERIIDPPMEKSPFLRGIRGPGFFAEPREGGEEEEEDETPRRRQPEAVTKRSSAAAVTPARAYVPATQAGRYPTPTYPQSTPSASTYRPPPSIAPQQRPSTGQPALLPSTNGRTIAALMGGPQVVDQVAVREYLPIEVGELLRALLQAPKTDDSARLFERDARNQVLWFSGPPLLPGQIKIPTQPIHSLEYLEYLTKRKAGTSTERDGPRGKRFRIEREPVTEEKNENEDTEDDLWWAQGMSSEQIEKSLMAVVDSA